MAKGQKGSVSTTRAGSVKGGKGTIPASAFPGGNYPSTKPGITSGKGRGNGPRQN